MLDSQDEILAEPSLHYAQALSASDLKEFVVVNHLSTLQSLLTPANGHNVKEQFFLTMLRTCKPTVSPQLKTLRIKDELCRAPKKLKDASLKEERTNASLHQLGACLLLPVKIGPLLLVAIYNLNL